MLLLPWQDHIKKSVIKLEWVLSSHFYQTNICIKMKKTIKITSGKNQRKLTKAFLVDHQYLGI